MHDLEAIRAFREDVADDEQARAAARDRLRDHIASGGLAAAGSAAGLASRSPPSCSCRARRPPRGSC